MSTRIRLICATVGDTRRSAPGRHELAVEDADEELSSTREVGRWHSAEIVVPRSPASPPVHLTQSRLMQIPHAFRVGVLVPAQLEHHTLSSGRDTWKTLVAFSRNAANIRDTPQPAPTERCRRPRLLVPPPCSPSRLAGTIDIHAKPSCRVVSVGADAGGGRDRSAF